MFRLAQTGRRPLPLPSAPGRQRRVGVHPSSASSGDGLGAPSLHRALDLAVGVALRDVTALIAYVLAPPERHLDLRAPILEVELRRDERQALLAHLAVEGLD